MKLITARARLASLELSLEVMGQDLERLNVQGQDISTTTDRGETAARMLTVIG